MTVEDAIHLLEELPPDKQAEIFDFIAFLHSRTATLVSSSSKPPLENEPLCGLWADREEMADSVAYVRGLREKE
jgi:hypothetical protein